MSIRLLRFVLLVVVLSSLVASAARAGSITASTKLITGPSNADPASSTFSVYAYAQSKDATNSKTSTNYPDVSKAPNVYKAETITVPVPGAGNQKVSPIVGFRDLNKPLVANDGPYPQGIYSKSEAGTAEGYGAVLVTKGVFGFVVEGNTKAGNKSIGAGTAIDPFAVDPGTHPYSYELSFSMQVFPTDPYTSLTAGAGDSSHPSLWSLSILATGPINSKSDLAIEFTSDSSLGLNDALVASSLRTAIDVTGGVASLTDYALFDTFYDTTSPTVYSDNLTGATASVPEPSTAALLLAGGLVVGVLVRRHRRSRSTTRRPR